MPSAPSCLRPSTAASGIFASRSISSGSTCSVRNARSSPRNASPFSTASGVEPRLRVDQVEAEVAQEQLLAEARELPVLLARRLRDFACLLLADLGRHGRSASRVHRGSGTSWYPPGRAAEACSLDAPCGARSWPSWRRPPRRRCSCAPRPATTRGRGCCGGARSPAATLSTADGPGVQAAAGRGLRAARAARAAPRRWCGSCSCARAAGVALVARVPARARRLAGGPWRRGRARGGRRVALCGRLRARGGAGGEAPLVHRAARSAASRAGAPGGRGSALALRRRRARCCGWRRGRSCALAGVVAWRRDAGACGRWLAALAVLVPAAWFVPEWLGSGDLLRSGARARIPNPGQPALADVPALASLWAAAGARCCVPLGRRRALALREPRAARRSRAAGGGVGRARRGDGPGRLLRRAALRAAGRRAARRGRRGRAGARRAAARRVGLARRARARARSPLAARRCVAAVPRSRTCATCAPPRRTSGRWRATSTTRSRAAGGREAVLALRARRTSARYRGPLMAYRARRAKRDGRARRARRARPASCSARALHARRAAPAPDAGPPFARRRARRASGRSCAAAPSIRVP